jgi:hypothetical protein
MALVMSPAEKALTPDDLTLRAQYEKEIENLRAEKATMPEDDYYAALEKIFLKLEAIYVKPVPPAPAQPAPVAEPAATTATPAAAAPPAATQP